MNTDRKSWWYTNSIGCSNSIQTEFESYLYKEQLNKIKSIYESGVSASASALIKSSLPLQQKTLDDDLYISKQTILNNDFYFNDETTSTISTVKTSKTNSTFLESFIRTNCFIPFYFIEIIHSGLLILLGIFCIIFGLLLSNAFNEDNENFDFIGGFDTTHIISSISAEDQLNSQLQPPSQHQQQHQLYHPVYHQTHLTLPRNQMGAGQIILDPVYTYVR